MPPRLSISLGRSRKGQKPALVESFTHRYTSVACEARMDTRHHCPYRPAVDAQRGAEPDWPPSSSVFALSAVPVLPAVPTAQQENTHHSCLCPQVSFAHTKHILVLSFLFFLYKYLFSV